MSISRYSRDPILNLGREYGTARGVMFIRNAVRQNSINLKEKILDQAERLDVIAGQQYGDGSLWWVIAAASDIGWGLQVPAGTRILIPTDLAQIADLVE